MLKIVCWLSLLVSMNLNGLQIEDVTELALKNNKKLKIAKYEEKLAESEYKTVRGLLYPQIHFNESYGVKETNNPEYVSDGITKETNLITALNLEQVVFSSKLFTGFKVAKVYNKLHKEKVRLSEDEVIYKARSLFYDALLAIKMVEITESALDLAKRRYGEVKIQHENGLVSEYDQLRAELEVENLKPELINAKKNVKLLRKKLASFLGVDDSIEIVGDFIIPNKLHTMSLDEVIDTSLSSRVEIKVAELNIKISKLKQKNEKLNFLPEISLKADAVSFTVSDKYKVNDDNYGSYASVSLNLSTPIFTGFSNQEKKRKTTKELKVAQIKQNQIKDEIELQVIDLFTTVEKNVESLEALKKSLDLANRNLIISQSRYDNKLGTILELMDAQLNKRNADLNYNLMKRNLINSYESLNLAMGRVIK